MAPLATILALALSLVAAGAAEPRPELVATYLFDLSGATGVEASTWARLTYDREHRELFVVSEGAVAVYNEAGMEVHRFGDDGELGVVWSVAPTEDGALLVLSAVDGRRAVVRCNFRGERLGEVRLSGVPPELGEVEPDAMVYAGGRLYLAELGRHRVVVADGLGVFERWIDLGAALRIDPRRSADADVAGFSVDGAGNLLLTMPMRFAAAVVSPRGEVRGFGARGSTPGKFNIAGAIVADEAGYLYLTDRLRSVVMVFDPALRFVGEFGYRGEEDGNLVTPYDVAVGNGRVFVAQAAGRGVRVFKVELR